MRFADPRLVLFLPPLAIAALGTLSWRLGGTRLRQLVPVVLLLLLCGVSAWAAAAIIAAWERHEHELTDLAAIVAAAVSVAGSLGLLAALIALSRADDVATPRRTWLAALAHGSSVVSVVLVEAAGVLNAPPVDSFGR